jgi:hypothetical protein
LDPFVKLLMEEACPYSQAALLLLSTLIDIIYLMEEEGKSSIEPAIPTPQDEKEGRDSVAVAVFDHKNSALTDNK